jgi:ABC-type Fe3+/spermidine/putrescine transport system ATPase subunit
LAYLQIEGLTKSFGSVTAVDHINFEVNKGEMIALLGASGCGKTTTLRMIAGFSTPTEGSIKLEGKVINNLPAHKRNIGMFFQNYALFPHLTTFENVAFGLKIKKMPKDVIRQKVAGALNMMKLVDLDKRLPRELSGGQQQRVALARAIVTEPALLLLDEPLSNLDAKLRVEMQVELKRIHREVGVTTIIVTHDQEEAMSMADRVIVMESGHILQNAAPYEIFNTPVNTRVANFMGITNFISGLVSGVSGGFVEVACSGGKLSGHAVGQEFAVGDGAVLAIRPTQVLTSAKPAEGYVPATIGSLTYRGDTTFLEVDSQYGSLQVSCRQGDALSEGEQIYIALPAAKLLVYPSEH